MKISVFLTTAFLVLLSACKDDQEKMQERIEGYRWNIVQYQEEYGGVKLDYKDPGYMDFRDDETATRVMIVSGDTMTNEFKWKVGFESIDLEDGTENRTFKVLTNEESKQVWEYSKEEEIIRYTLTR